MASSYHHELRGRTLLLRLLPATTARNLTRRRKMMARMKSKLGPGVAVEDRVVERDGLRVPVRIYRPIGPDQQRPTLLWLHGGGLVLGTHEDDQQCSRFATDLGLAVVSVGYRLAPEHPFPAALDDIAAAAGWLLDEGAEHGLDPDRWVIGGQSAGGGLAAAAAARLNADGISPNGQLLIYPMLDDRTVARPDIGETDHLVWNNRSNDTGWTAYLGVPAGHGDVPPGAVPARLEDLSGLPPAWIGVGTRDLFHDEDLEYGERLKAAGVDCELMVVPGMVHGFDMIVSKGDATRDFHASQDRFLRTVLALDGELPV